MRGAVVVVALAVVVVVVIVVVVCKTAVSPLSLPGALVVTFSLSPASEEEVKSYPRSEWEDLARVSGWMEVSSGSANCFTVIAIQAARYSNAAEY